MEQSNLYSDSIHITYDEGDESLEREPYIHTSSVDDTTHVVRDGDTLSGIAMTYYKDPALWYMIADVNGYYNPFAELEEGQEILIPHGKQQ